MPETEREINIRSEDVGELLAVPPKWIVRWGISMVFLILILTLLFSYFIRYPDIVQGKATITTLNPPVSIVARVNGKISQLLVQNNQEVKKSQLLAVIENTANHGQVLELEKILQSRPSDIIPDSVNTALLSTKLNELGELTAPYLAFLKALNDYRLFREINPQLKEISIIDKELIEYGNLLKKNQEQENIQREEFMLVQKDYERAFTLFESKTISLKELEDKKKEFLQAKRNYESVKINTSTTRITVNNLEKNKIQLQMQQYERETNYKQAFNDALKTLLNTIVSWKRDYLLLAPFDGKTSFYAVWHENEHVKAGDEILSIVPVAKQQIVGKLLVPTQNSGKIKVGQQVNIRLDNYPYEEYGYLQGNVASISPVPKQNSYAVEVTLPHGITTSYQKELAYKEEMQGQADVITEDISMMDRIFFSFRKLLKRN
jgi:multidrug resistance efflux pump